MTRPRCSIIVATYNKADLLELSLQSIRDQAVPFEYELIVVDDGSSDHTAKICANFDVRYAYLDRPYYCNSAAARNVGLRMAQADVLIMQCEIIHDTPDAIELLTTRARSGMIDFAAVYDAEIDLNGEKTPKTRPITAVRAKVPLSGPHNPRPFFFLGAAMRADVYSVGGNDEEFVKPGYEDNWFSDCLIRGRGCSARHWADVLGWHVDHWRPKIPALDTEAMRNLYEAKVATGVFCASGGPWSIVPLTDESNVST